MTREWNAAAYHRISDPQFTWGKRVLDRLALRGTEHVLDAGCGSGRLTLELARRVNAGRVVAVDLSENMIRMAASVLGGALGRSIERRWDVVCADLPALPFRGAFDVAFSTATFHWIRDHDALFAAIYHALRAGGRLEAQCGGRGNLGKVLAQAECITTAEPFRAYFESWTEPWQFADAATTERRLRAAGFSRATCWMEAMPATFTEPEDYRLFLETVVMRQFLDRLPTSDLRAALLGGMVDRGRDGDPPYTLDYWRLNMSASRP